MQLCRHWRSGARPTKNIPLRLRLRWRMLGQFDGERWKLCSIYCSLAVQYMKWTCISMKRRYWIKLLAQIVIKIVCVYSLTDSKQPVKILWHFYMLGVSMMLHGASANMQKQWDETSFEQQSRKFVIGPQFECRYAYLEGGLSKFHHSTCLLSINKFLLFMWVSTFIIGMLANLSKPVTIFEWFAFNLRHRTVCRGENYRPLILLMFI